jgi:hypothetical protein
MRAVAFVLTEPGLRLLRSHSVYLSGDLYGYSEFIDGVDSVSHCQIRRRLRHLSTAHMVLLVIVFHSPVCWRSARFE